MYFIIKSLKSQIFKNMFLQRIINPIFMWLIIIAGVVICLILLPNNKLFSLGIFGWIIFIACAFYWIYILSKGLPLHRQAIRSVAGIDHLLTDGIYKLSRHPLYGAHIVMAWGVFFLIATLKVLAIVIWLNIFLVLWAKLEEWGLQKKFGQVYTDYKKTTPMIISHLSLKKIINLL